MRKSTDSKCILILFVLFCSALCAYSQEQTDALLSEPAPLFSPSISNRFYEIAYNIVNSDNLTYIDNDKAITFLLAARNLGGNSSDINSLLLNCMCRFPEQMPLQKKMAKHEYIDLVYTLLLEYVDQDANLDIAENAVSCMLGKLDTSTQREVFLRQMLDKFIVTNPVFASEIATILGTINLQKDLPEEAEKYFKQAYQYNKNNKIAFNKLVELYPEKLEPADYIKNFRYSFSENPVDLHTVLSFALQAEQMQLYEIAADVYEYGSELFKYLFPSEQLPSEIYIPWAISCYNSRKHQFKCMEIAESIRQTGRFDLTLESLASRAAAKLGEDSIALRIIQDAEKKAIESINNNTGSISEAQLAWLYSFVIPIPDRALEWANRAFSKDPKSPSSASLLAYALTQKKEYNSAISIINNTARNQISELALAQIQIEQGQASEAIENLQSSILRDPGSFAAEHAKASIIQLQGQYIPPVDNDSILASLEKTFGLEIVPAFTPPEKIFSAKFNIRNRELSYGEDLDCAITITNKSNEPLVISDDSMFKGNIRIDAVVTGDISRKIPNLVSKRIETALPLKSGGSKIINVKLITGQLRDMLMTYPQATFNINFLLYLDPVTTTGDRVKNSLNKVAPVSANVTRSGIVINGQYIKSLVDTISTGQTGEKIRSAQIFIGLLKEQNAFAGRNAPYRIVFADGMKSLLESALIYDTGLKHTENSDWIVKVQTLTELLSLPLDFELIEAVSQNLYNSNWPVRMVAVHLLAQSQGKNFANVLESISMNDSNQLVKNIANISVSDD